MNDNRNGKFYKDKYLLLLALICITVMAYWLAYANYKYISFGSEYYDIGVAVYSTYIHIYHPGITGGLQYLSFYNHISLFALLTLPIFALLPGPLTLIAMQDASLAIAAIVLYMCVKELLRNRAIAFAFGAAFIFNIGVRGIMIWDFHPEGFIPLLFLLAFYFYIKDRLLGFSISYVLLLSVMETSWPVGVALILGLLYYEFFYNKKTDLAEKAKRKKRIRAMLMLLVVTLLFIAFYYYLTQTLLNMYASGMYPNLPPQLRILNYNELQIANLPVFLASNINTSAWILIMIGVLILFLGFGISSLADPILVILFISPWLFEALVLHNFDFANFYLDYYSFAVAGSAIAAVLGIKLILEKKSYVFNKIVSLPKMSNEKIMAHLIILLALSTAFLYILFAPPPFPIISGTTYKNYTQIQAALSKIPSNASVMLQANIYPHLYYIERLEFPPNTVYNESVPGGIYSATLSFYWFKPNYVIIYPSKNVWFASYNNDFNTSTFNIYAYMGSNFTLYNSVDGVEIYKRN